VATVTILGAGAMGSALATPAAAAGNRVRLWGTWLDDDLLAGLRAGRPHPRTGVPPAPGVALHPSGELADALDGADLVAVATCSRRWSAPPSAPWPRPARWWPWAFGARVGRGEPPAHVLAAMAAAGQTVEGVPAARLALELATGRDLVTGLPLLETVNRILDGAADPAALLADAVLPG
jgi:glycerol-3-phosphate dehydrogenase